jgi:hypothetical protein
MNLRRLLLIATAAIAIALSTFSYGLPLLIGGCEPTAGACQRCGDGYCAKSCENQYTCPKDCGVTGGTTATAR